MKNENPLLVIKEVHKAYDKVDVVNGVSLELQEGEIGCLLGPSGCGKTSLLRVIAGFEDIHHGEVIIAGQQVSSSSIMVPPEKRNIGMVFQDYALFPHLSVYENIAFGISKGNRHEKRKTVEHLLDLVGLQDTGKAYPHELSGGQQQRVALARALAPAPALLLLDEPFSNLDVTLREKLTVEVRDILKESGTTALMVTHNQFEAFSVSDSVGVIFDGSICQWDSAYNIYHSPETLDVATFVGDGAIIRGKVTGSDSVACGLGELTGNLSLPCESGCNVDLLVRPEDILHDDHAQVKAKIIHKSFRGPNILYKLELSTREPCLALVSSHHNHMIGEMIGIVPEVENLVVFPSAPTLFNKGNGFEV
ncbi:ABC transporter ATP-binding protein [Desulfopila sp. IMCC35008]|uniref:ABC transporter ATP-binding protein n=1 Tax=Desulfopila sp. IMCC35008 TaxID=2653858 RepID=UPI0013D4F4F9|nr:ABC transporter ATP-binding protein [Desulfopila sp. IMCC35008]